MDVSPRTLAKVLSGLQRRLARVERIVGVYGKPYVPPTPDPALTAYVEAERAAAQTVQAGWQRLAFTGLALEGFTYSGGVFYATHPGRYLVEAGFMFSGSDPSGNARYASFGIGTSLAPYKGQSGQRGDFVGANMYMHHTGIVTLAAGQGFSVLANHNATGPGGIAVSEAFVSAAHLAASQ